MMLGEGLRRDSAVFGGRLLVSWASLLLLLARPTQLGPPRLHLRWWRRHLGKHGCGKPRCMSGGSRMVARSTDVYCPSMGRALTQETAATSAQRMAFERALVRDTPCARRDAAPADVRAEPQDLRRRAGAGAGRPGRPAGALRHRGPRESEGDFTSELARFNLEVNLEPAALGPGALSALEQDLHSAVGRVREAAAPLGARRRWSASCPRSCRTIWASQHDARGPLSPAQRGDPGAPAGGVVDPHSRRGSLSRLVRQCHGRGCQHQPAAASAGRAGRVRQRIQPVAADQRAVARRRVWLAALLRASALVREPRRDLRRGRRHALPGQGQP